MSGRTAGRRGGVGQDCMPTNCSPRGQSFLVPSKASKTRRLNVSPEARTNEILCKPMEEQSPRLNRGSSAVHQRFISGTRSALCSWLPASGTTLFCVCKPFSCKACPGTVSSKHFQICSHMCALPESRGQTRCPCDSRPLCPLGELSSMRFSPFACAALRQQKTSTHGFYAEALRYIFVLLKLQRFARLCKMGRRQNSSPRRRASFVPLMASEKRLLNYCLKHELFPDMLRMKRVYRDRGWYTGQ